MNTTETFGFILLRHVNSAESNQFWKRSYDSIRRWHPTSRIVIIDDNSNPTYLTPHDKPLTNCEIIQSQFHARGELLPFYYYYHHKFFDKAIILHDSMFLNREIYPDRIRQVDKVLYLWHFHHQADPIEQQRGIIANSLMSYKKELLQFHDQPHKWVGCFGVCAIITHAFLKHLFEKYIMVDLMNRIRTKDSRCCLERIFSILCHMEEPNLIHNPSLLGRIEFYMYPLCFNIHYEEYLQKIDQLNSFPIVKIWSGR